MSKRGGSRRAVFTARNPICVGAHPVEAQHRNGFDFARLSSWRRNIEPIASSRFYHFAGAQHSAGTLPLTDTNSQNGERGQQALNSVDYNPLLRALLVRMDRWVSQGEEPPPSHYPRLADGSAVAPEKVRDIV